MWNGRNKDVERLLKLRGQQCPFSDEVCTKVSTPRSAVRASVNLRVYSGVNTNIEVFKEDGAKQDRPIFQDGKS